MGHVVGLTRLQVPSLAQHYHRRVVYSAFGLVASGLAIAAITAVAYWSGDPLVVPSLGPTAFLVFNRSQSTAAWPRNIICGHIIGAAAGYLALVAFGLQHVPSVVEGGLTPPRIGAAAFSIALTSGAMVLLGVEHGPAGATTLIVSLGFMRTPTALGLLMAGVVGLAIIGLGIDRASGLQLPFWAGRAVQLRTSPFQPELAGPPGPSLLPGAGPRSGNGNGHSPTGEPNGKRPRRRAESPTWMVEPGRGRQVLVGAGQCTVKVQDARTGGSYSLLEVVFDPHLPATLLHVHYNFAETYFVLEGEVTAEVGAERRRAVPGSTISVPAGTPHVLAAAGGRPARCLCVTDRTQH
ncbi:MAG: HPP family protein, partial [Acidimicrobiales bacterium]